MTRTHVPFALPAPVSCNRGSLEFGRRCIRRYGVAPRKSAAIPRRRSLPRRRIGPLGSSANLCYGALVLLLGAAPGVAQVGPSPDPSPSAVDRVFAPFAGPATPGCAVGVSRNGEPVLLRAYGMADLEHDVPNGAETIFEAGSVSKQFTAAAIVLLAQEGKLSLDDDVRKHIPELPTYQAPITIRHLLNHTSGLRDWGSLAGIGGWPRTSRVHTHEHVLDIVARQKALNYTPGEFYSYTNTGYNLQAMIVERVSGMSLAEFTRRRLFEPLGMSSTGWRDDFTRVVRGRSIAYERAGDGFAMDMPFENAHGNGGLLTTVGDLLRWTWALERGALGGPGFMDEMQRRAVLNSGRTITYASGLVVSEYKGVPEVGHSGSTAGYRAHLMRFPEQDLGVAVLCNAAHAGATALARQVADLYLGSVVQEEAARDGAEDGAAVAREALAARVGVYRNTRTQEGFRLTLEGGRLLADGRRLVPESPSRFRLGGGVLVFEGDRPGAAPFLTIGADGDTVRFLPEPDFAPGARELAEYAGSYASSEAEATYTVSVEEERLLLRGRFGEGRPLEPVYPDAFEGEGGTYRFLRDAAGRVSELSMVQARVWDLRLQRQPATNSARRP